jgi:hypothetical protein
MSISTKISSELDVAYSHFNPQIPVSPSSPYYVNCDEVRGEQGEYVAEKMTAELSMVEGDVVHFLFTGHVGSGKSSELRKVKEILENQYNYQVVYFDAADELDLYDVHHTDLLLAIASQLFADKQIEIDAKTLENVQNWFKEITKTTTDIKESGAEIEAGVKMGGGFPWLGELFANFKANIRRNKEQRAEIREQFKPKVSDLLIRVNRLIDAARKDVQHKGKQDLVLIIDNLEKMSPNLVKEENKEADVSLFVDYGNLLLGLDCHLICTVPIRLLYLPLGSKLFDDFSKVFTLPVIKIKKYCSTTPSENGVRKFMDIANLRLQGLKSLENLALFNQDETLLANVIQFCGGNVKTFIRLMRQMIFQCKVEQKFPLDKAMIDKVFRQEMRDYDRMISNDRIRRLVQVAYTHQIDITEKSPDSEMLQLGWILVYANTKEWSDVEPVIRCLDRFKKEWKEITTQENPIQVIAH